MRFNQNTSRVRRIVAVSLSALLLPAPDARAAGADFNGDGFADLAIPVPGESIGAMSSAGAVNVMYGSPAGLSADGNQFWHQDSPGILNNAESNDQFGRTVAHGDFNGDGFSDLALGVPLEDVGSKIDAGAVNVLYGSAEGLSDAGNQFWHQNKAGIKNKAEPLDLFGSALACGDFDGDGYSDLAISAKGESIGEKVNAGAVHVLFGSAAGLSADHNQIWHQNSAGVLNKVEANDFFGGSLAAADFNSDGRDDLAIGVAQEGLNGQTDAGAVHVLYGSINGLTAANDDLWHQNSVLIQDVCEAFDYFGHALAAGDFDGDGFADLAVGVPYESLGGQAFAGIVTVLYGSPSGLLALGSQLWSQDQGSIQETADPGDFFGFSLCADDFDGDGIDDLIIAAPEEILGAISHAGLVHVLFGGGLGLSDVSNQVWSEEALGLGEIAQSGTFGNWLASGDFAGNGTAGLAIGDSLEGVVDAGLAGAVVVIYGISPGGTLSSSHEWTQDSPGILDEAEDGDAFGAGPYP
ncbi:MAG: hypothetical protein L0219_12125 [Phycisphaerales bacterium]|nr:hypothetical protein [Phycisphaerales bacterium]